MGLSTPLSDRIGLTYPFMQSGMGGIGPLTLAPLAAAVSNAGALGTLAQPALVLEEGADPRNIDLDAQIARCVEQVRDGIRSAVSLTSRPLAINVRVAREQPDAPHVVRAILEEREADARVRAQLTVLSTSGGHPSTYGLNGDIRDSGMLHFHAVSNVAQALTAEREGLDAVVATGFEAAGHVGHKAVHTFVLVPSVAAAVSIPVLAAGGVVDGAALAGALSLGAEMGYIGSRFLAAEECEYHQANKDFIVRAAETSTSVVPCFFGPARFIANGFTREVARMQGEDTPTLERMQIEGAAMRRGALEGDMETGMMIGGMAIGRISRVLPAAEIVAEIAEDAERAIARVSGFRVAAGTPSG